MQVQIRFYDHRNELDSNAEPMTIWHATEAPAREEFVNLDCEPGGEQTWIVRYRVWREEGTRVDVICSRWQHNL